MQISVEDVQLTRDQVVEAVGHLFDDYEEAHNSHYAALARIAEIHAQTQRLMCCLHMAEQPDLPVEGLLALAVAEVIRRLPVDEHLPAGLRDGLMPAPPTEHHPEEDRSDPESPTPQADAPLDTSTERQ